MANFPEHIVNYALLNQEKYNVPASVTLAQWALESGYGSSAIARNNNNPFGIRNNKNRSGEFGENGFMKYPSISVAFDDHGKIMSSSLYTSKTAGTKSVEEYVKAFSETYAPSSDGNSNYSGKLLRIIDSFNLKQYDNMSYLGGGGYKETPQVETKSGGGFFSSIVVGISILLILAAVGIFFYKSIGG